MLGLVGADHLRSIFVAAGVGEESFAYRKRLGIASNGLPYVVEAAYGFRPNGNSRRLITGVNFSAAIGSPFERLKFRSIVGFTYDTSLTGIAAQQHIHSDSPVVLALHYTAPGIQFADRGKGIGGHFDLDENKRRHSVRDPG